MIKRITSKPPRWKEEKSLYFLTMCTHGRMPFLHVKQVPEMILHSLNFCRTKVKDLLAYTVMPDHLHLMVEIEEAKELSSFLRDFKSYTSKEIKRITEITQKHVWQRGTMDHCIRESNSNTDFENHLQYLFFNSVKHLGIAPKEFPYHNFTEIVKRGWLENEFCDFEANKSKRFEIYE